MLKSFLSAAVLYSLLAATPTFAAAPDSRPNPRLVIDLPSGRVVAELRPDLAPKTVAQITKLVQQGYYDDLAWFRVVDGFVAQTGYKLGTNGKSDLPDLPAEFSKYKFKRGTLGMGRGDDPDSANSQFFICYTDDGCKDLTGKYTAFGQVLEGMDAVDSLKRGTPPKNPDETVKMTVEAPPAAPTK